MSIPTTEWIGGALVVLVMPILVTLIAVIVP